MVYGKTKVTLQHDDINSGNEVQIFCTGVSVILNKNNDKKPNANYSTTQLARVQSLSLENPKFTLSNVKLMDTLTYELLLQFYKLSNDESNTIKLNVTYGTKASLSDNVDSNFKQLVGFDGTTTSIPVTFDGALTIPFDTTQSTNAYRPSFNINLVEVRTS